jgi:hypothetical protein
MDKRLDAQPQRLDRFLFWSFSLIVSAGALVVATMRLWA